MDKQAKNALGRGSQNKLESPERLDSLTLLESFRHHEKSLRHYISSFFITSQDIEDISQETFLRTFKSDIQEKVKKPKSFMFRVAKNLIISEYRRSSYKLTDYIEDIEYDAQPLDIANLENDFETQHMLGLFCEGLAGLPEQCRKIMVMRKVYGLSIKEISERLGLATSTINWNLAKGMTHCDDIIEKDEKKSARHHGDGKNGKVSADGIHHAQRGRVKK